MERKRTEKTSVHKEGIHGLDNCNDNNNNNACVFTACKNQNETK